MTNLKEINYINSMNPEEQAEQDRLQEGVVYTTSLSPEVKEDNTPDWEEEFDSRWPVIKGSTQDKEWNGVRENTKSFIRSLILAREQEARTKAIDEAMEAMPKELNGGNRESDKILESGYNTARTEALTALQALKNK